MSALDSLENRGQCLEDNSSQAGPSWVWGLPLAPWTRQEAVEAVLALVKAGQPSFFITANLHYAMLSHQSPELQAVNDRAAFLLADGAPLVWASHWLKKRVPLPERVAGSDLIFDLCEVAAARGLGVFLLGGAPGVADEAACQLCERYPRLRIVGTAAPILRELSEAEHKVLLKQIQATHPDMLLLAATMPNGECWIAENLEALGVPLCVNVGASIDFAAGRVRRAPRWMQRVGLEWAYRTYLEPRRLAPRYARNALFLFRMVFADFWQATIGRRKNRQTLPEASSCLSASPDR